jgi:predicted outer membrane repeat protein
MGNVFVIYNGCKHEGGGILGKAYLSFNRALKYLIEYKFELEKDYVDSQGKFIPGRMSMGEEYYIYKEVEPGYWETEHDILLIKKLEICED